jgi:glycosyltransferase involved in cell wall biosynthesis
MKILINRKPIEGPWGGGNLFLKSFCKIMKTLGHEVIHSIQPGIDIFFIMNPRYNELGISINEAIAYKQKNKSTKIIQRINDCDARKNTSDVDELLMECSKYLDSTIFVSEWMKNYFLSKGWHCNKNYVVINGVETITDNVKKIKNKKLNIVTHHWSNNYLKGFDIYDQLDEFVGKNNEYTFSYVGRERGTFKNTNIIPPLAGEDLYKELKKYDVYVSASRYDPGPNHILESISCNLPTYVHKDGGGCVEFAGPNYVFNNFEELIKLLKQNNHQKNKNKFVGWKESIVSLNKIIENLLKGN